MKNLSIAMRIRLGFLLLLLVMTATGISSLLAFSRIENKVDEVAAHDLVFFSGMADLRTHMGNLRRFEKDYFIHVAEPSARASYLVKWKAALDKAQLQLKNSLGKASDSTVDQQVNLLSSQLAQYQQGFSAVSAQIEAGQISQTQAANQAMEKYKSSIHAMEGTLKQVSDQSAATAGQLPQLINATADSAKNLVLLLNLLALVLGVILALLIVGSIRRPLAMIGNTSTTLASERNLNLAIPEFGQNEIGAVGRALQTLVTTVAELVRQSHGYSARLVSSAEQLDSLSQNVTGAMQQQTRATAASAAAIQQITTSMHAVADHTRSVEQQAHGSVEEAEKGHQMARQAQNDIQQIAEQVNLTADAIEALNRRSAEIGSIVQVIHEIADQTNLLALNAAIEAARAGESGRGFAVVADEVRKLAERTSKATTEIAAHIQSVQSETLTAHQNMSAANQAISSGVSSAQSMTSALDEIRAHSQLSVGKMAEISIAIQEQSAASSEMARNIEQISEMSDSANQAVQQSSALARSLKTLSAELDLALNRFKA